MIGLKFFFRHCIRFKQESSFRVGNRSFRKGLDFAPIQKKVNELKLKRDFQEFCKCMRIN